MRDAIAGLVARRENSAVCDGADHDHDVAEQHAARPRSIEGDAIDPISLEPVDEVVIMTLVDNSYDGLMGDMGLARRAPMGRTPRVAAAQFEQGETVPGLLAEHGFAALVTTRRGDRSHTLLFDTGVSPNGLADNMERLGISAADIEALVLSHNHLDHAGGLLGLARMRRRAGLPITVHPDVWSPRRVMFPGAPEWQLPTLSRRSLEQRLRAA